jgi:hypothetical protein
MPSKWTDTEAHDARHEAAEFSGSLLQRFMLDELDRLLDGNLAKLENLAADFPATCVLRGERKALSDAKVLIKDVLNQVAKHARRNDGSR